LLFSSAPAGARLDCFVASLLAMTAEALRDFLLQLSNSDDARARHRPVFISATGQAVLPILP
jgi:hypothetical protein